MASEAEIFEHMGISGSTENSKTNNVFLGWWLSMENMGHTSNSLEDKYEGERIAWTRVGRWRHSNNTASKSPHMWHI